MWKWQLGQVYCIEQLKRIPSKFILHLSEFSLNLHKFWKFNNFQNFKSEMEFGIGNGPHSAQGLIETTWPIGQSGPVAQTSQCVTHMPSTRSPHLRPARHRSYGRQKRRRGGPQWRGRAPSGWGLPAGQGGWRWDSSRQRNTGEVAEVSFGGSVPADERCCGGQRWRQRCLAAWGKNEEGEAPLHQRRGAAVAGAHREGWLVAVASWNLTMGWQLSVTGMNTWSREW
jgi:hypothetical protein